jgi:hypothetical protein
MSQKCKLNKDKRPNFQAKVRKRTQKKYCFFKGKVQNGEKSTTRHERSFRIRATARPARTRNQKILLCKRNVRNVFSFQTKSLGTHKKSRTEYKSDLACPKRARLKTKKNIFSKNAKKKKKQKTNPNFCAKTNSKTLVATLARSFQRNHDESPKKKVKVLQRHKQIVKLESLSNFS